MIDLDKIRRQVEEHQIRCRILERLIGRIKQSDKDLNDLKRVSYLYNKDIIDNIDSIIFHISTIIRNYNLGIYFNKEEALGFHADYCEKSIRRIKKKIESLNDSE